MAKKAGKNGNASSYYINVGDYYDKLHHTTWARRTAGMLAGATLGGGYGLVIGTMAAFLPYAFSAVGLAAAGIAAPALGTVLASAALFAVVTAFIGMAVTTDVSTNAASSAAGMEEKEKREHFQHLQDGTPSPEYQKALEEDEKRHIKRPPFFNWKIPAVTVPLFAAFGALMGVNSFTAATVVKEAFPALAADATASIIASATMFGMFGTLLGFRNSDISNKLCNFYFKLVTSQLFDKEAKAEKVPEKNTARSEELASGNEPSRETKFATDKMRFSLQGLIEKTEERPNPGITR